MDWKNFVWIKKFPDPNNVTVSQMDLGELNEFIPKKTFTLIALQ